MNRYFKIVGMDCAEEVAVLKSELGPLVGDERCIRVSAWVLPADNDVTRRSYLPIIFDQ